MLLLFICFARPSEVVKVSDCKLKRKRKDERTKRKEGSEQASEQERDGLVIGEAIATTASVNLIISSADYYCLN